MLRRSILIAGIMVAQGFPAIPEPTAHWTFDEGSGLSFHDVSGHGHHGVLEGAKWSSGIHGFAIEFDGLNDLAWVADREELSGMAQLSMILWIYPYKNHDRPTALVRKWGPQSRSDDSYATGIGRGSWNTYLSGSNSFDGRESTYDAHGAGIVYNEWNQLAFVWDGKTLTYYTNGRKTFTNPSIREAIQVTREPITLGASSYPGGGYGDWYHGKMDEISLYDVPLTDKYILDNYTRFTNQSSTVELIAFHGPQVARPKFRWHPFLGALRYTFEVSNTAAFDKVLATASGQDTTFRPSAALPSGEHFWRVSALTEMGTKTSVVGHVLIEDTHVPRLIPVVPKVRKDRRPRLSWHPVAVAGTYTVGIFSNSDTRNPIALLPTTDTAFSPSADLPTGFIAWSVKSNLSDSWANRDFFYIQSDSLPFLHRFNGAMFSNPRPKFQWNKVTGVESYRIRLNQKGVPGNTILVPTADTTFSPFADLSAGMWQWSVSSSLDFSRWAPADSLVVQKATSLTPYGADREILGPPWENQLGNGMLIHKGKAFLPDGRQERD